MSDNKFGLSHRFAYTKFDSQSQDSLAGFRDLFQQLEVHVDGLADGRAKALVYTKLEEAFMWVGKALRDTQIARTGKVEV